MQLPRLTPRAFRQITLGALAALVFIVVTGGAVRLTGSGLGCTDWPNCTEDRLVAPWEYHAMVEFVNRTVTGLVSLAVIVAVLGARLRVPHRRDLTWLSAGLVAGVVGQIVLGGLTVLFDLHPVLVMSHFILSMVLITNAVVLHHRAGWPDGATPAATAGPATARLVTLLLAAAAAAIVSGTVVTASGPHGGDEDVRRLGFALRDVARIHGLAVVLFVAVVLLVMRAARREGAAPAVQRSALLLVAAAAVQAAVGYTQYFTGVPPLLVGVHIAGATAVWIAALRVRLTLAAPSTGDPPVRRTVVSSLAGP